MTSHEGMIRKIEAFCRDRGMAESTFGRLAVNDGKFVRRLREDRRVTTATVAQI